MMSKLEKQIEVAYENLQAAKSAYKAWNELVEKAVSTNARLKTFEVVPITGKYVFFQSYDLKPKKVA